ncbi:ABC transporter B family member 15-like [Gossypium australe]|uniref:ABC transporter B family member 15-like n=1 Tax=Gossypium australe TaxID=47621 RepID=A0A5B6UHE3_9ROSI|nr:ABC transporter B family member 15-like [Gossypium australe]
MADERKTIEEVESSPLKKKNRCIRSIFMHANNVDWFLMAAGFIGGVVDGTVAPLMIYLNGRLFNNLDASSKDAAADMLTRNVHHVALLLILTACGGWVGCFIEGFCWTRTSERQATRMRSRYLKAILRQDVGYFDLNVTSTADVVTSVSNDSLIIQEVISEKIPHLIARGTSFIGAYIIAFLVLWKLALVIFPFVLLLVVPSLIYGKNLLSLARKTQMEYKLASTIAEQAISSIRTVYAFVGENKTSIKFSEALQGSVKLGLKQGWAKGLALGSSGITHLIWAFVTYYGSRLIMYHGAKGGTIYIVGTCITFGGHVSTLKPLFEACSAAERINEVIKRIPKIDLGNMEGEILDNVIGEIEFKQATSALDSESECIVQEALDKASVGHTTIIIAHRLSTIRHADLIAVVQDGQVTETGSHDELMGNEMGLYPMLVQLQHTEQEQVKEKGDKDLSTNAIDINNASSHRLSLASRTSSANSVAANHSSLCEEMNVEDKKLPAPSFKRLLAMNLPEWKEATLGCLGAVLYGAVQPLSAFIMGLMISMFFISDHGEIKEKAKVYALSFLGIGLFSLIINVIQHYNFAYMGEHLTKRIREGMLSKILTFEVGWFDQDENSSGTVCSRLAKDASVVRSLVGDRMSLLMQTISGVTLACVMGLFLSWRLSLVMIVLQPLIIFSLYSRMVLLKSMSKKAIKAQQDSSKLAAEAVSNHRTITAFSSQDRILKMMEKAYEGPRKESVRQSWFTGLGFGSAQFLTACIVAFNFWYGGKLISQGYISSEALIQTFLILVSTGLVIAEAASMTSDLVKSSEVVASLFAILDHCTRIGPDDSNGYIAEEITGHVEIHDVDFAYPARPNVIILKNFSFTVEAGRSTALVGQSGSGKSTIISLIERFYDPLKGVVKIDGRDIKSYNLKTLRKHIALVSQEPTLFVGTIRENILYGASDETDESEVIEAAKAANAHDFIAGLANGYETWCGDRGVQLSGGQKQRIAIARAVLKKPTILLLDEATSALDCKSEKVVQEALERLMVGRTSVVVAHRLSTIQNCNLIAVLEQGKVVEKGSHSSLLAKGSMGAYYSLVNLQRKTHNSTQPFK